MVSIVINVDTRPGFMKDCMVSELQMEGVRSLDFLTEGVLNKIQFFSEFEKEVILYIDVHDPLPAETEKCVMDMHKEGLIDTLIFNRHNETKEGIFYPKWNDMNFLNAIALARCEYVAHFDGDVAAFRSNPQVIEQFKDWVNSRYKYVSYQSQWSPSPDCDRNWDYYWASTRFFFCRRESIDYSEIVRCLDSDDYLYSTYGEKYRRVPWLEHILGILAGPSKVYYPKVDPFNFLIFAWSRYYSGILSKLNRMSYGDVYKYIVNSCGGMSYPCDVCGVKI